MEKQTRENQGIAKDEAGRVIFDAFAQQNKITVNGHSKDRYAKWDVAYTLKGQKYLGEIKVRKNNSDTYPTYLLELDKFHALKNKIKNRTDLRISYINHFENNMTYIWDITDLDITKYNIELRWLPIDDWGEELVQKQVIFLYNCDANKFETDSSKSIFNQLNEEDREDDVDLPW